MNKFLESITGKRSFHLLLILSIFYVISSGSVLSTNGPYQPIQPIQPIPNLTFDPIPPVTNISLSGTQGENGWFTSDVTVTLEAADNQGTWNSGLKGTFYSVIHEDQQFSLSLEYTEPFTVSREGKNTVRYHSIDNYDNSEETNIEEIRIDKTEPQGSMSIKGQPEYVSERDIQLSLSGTDGVSGLATVRLKTEGGSWSDWRSYSSSMNWQLSSGDGEKTIMAQLKDRAGQTSETYQDQVILDTSAPSISLGNENGSVVKSNSVTINWSATDEGSGIDSYQVRVDGGSWKNAGTDSSYTFENLEGGEHVFEIKVADELGQTEVKALEMVVNTTPIGGPSMLEELLIVVLIIAVAIGGVLYWLSKRPEKPPEPAQLRVTADPDEIIADGKSTSTITVQLLDEKGEPVEANADTEAKLKASSGSIVNPVVKIAQGSDSGTAVLGSSTKFGSVNVTVESSGLASSSVSVTFKEKPRFCMGCGSRMSVGEKRCENCGASPSKFAGPETKTCHCGAVLPYTANYCSECGAKQSRAGEFSGEGPEPESQE